MVFLSLKTPSPAIVAAIFDFWPREPGEETKWGERGGVSPGSHGQKSKMAAAGKSFI